MGQGNVAVRTIQSQMWPVLSCTGMNQSLGLRCLSEVSRGRISVHKR
jgi:hypothetical protein